MNAKFAMQYPKQEKLPKSNALPITSKCPRNTLKPNEIPFKQWRFEMAERLGISEASVVNRIYTNGSPRKRIPYPPVRRVNARVVFVILNP